MKVLFSVIALLFLSGTCFAELNQEFFYNKVYKAEDGGTLELHPEDDPDDEGFKNCVVRWADGTAFFDCSWEYAKRENAVIVWVSGNRDWWDVEEDGKVIKEGSYVKRLVSDKPKKLTSKDFVGRIYRERPGKQMELILLGSKSSDNRKTCLQRWGGRGEDSVASYNFCSWSTDRYATKLSIYFPDGRGDTYLNRTFEVQPGGRLLRDTLELVQIQYPRN